MLNQAYRMNSDFVNNSSVAVSYTHLEAFRKVAARELPPEMELLDPDAYRGGKAFYDFTPRIIYKNSRCHPDSPEMAFYGGKLNHVWVDLFITDRLPKSKAGMCVTRLLQKAIYGMAMGHRYRLDYEKYSPLHKLFVGVLATVGRFIPLKAIFAMQRAVSLKDRHSKGSLRYYSNYQPDYLYAVSYTHLDVYKRQVWRCAGCTSPWRPRFCFWRGCTAC